VSRYNSSESLESKQEAMRQRAHKLIQQPIHQEYSVNEAAQLLGLSRWTVTRLFETEAGIRIYGNEKSTRNRRRQRTIRIPENVLRRVQERHTVR
jgi:AraC-like DNA-binding protein